MTSDELRQRFLDFFGGRGHEALPAASLVPGDPTALFTSAGMQQFVPVFKGEIKPSAPRAATCQKCFRADDLDNVGLTARHHTFFEMLGNFSFGDYFKREAIFWAWEFSTGDLGLPKERLWASVYEDDEEAYGIWLKDIGLPAERIVRLGKKENWWGPVGDSGPCGPCSELYFDVGEKHGCGATSCAPGCDCDRYLEFWNLVFQMYNQAPDGTLTPLPKPGIDTGMGLERAASLVQGQESNFQIDSFRPIFDHLARLARVPFSLDPRDHSQPSVAARVIGDHARAIVFLIADGVLPSNEWRGYVLRRVIRRAFRFGRTLGINEPFLYALVPSVTAAMRAGYPALDEQADFIACMVKAEEERFQSTLEQGTLLLDRTIADLRAQGKTVIPGAVAFELHDTYGFPRELTEEMAAAQGLGLDGEGYSAAMTEQRERARASARDTFVYDHTADYARFIGKTEFIGYATLRTTAQVIGLIRDKVAVESAGPGEEVDVILDHTPFYAETGGQVGDTGLLVGVGSDGTPVRVQVTDCRHALEGVIAHRAKVETGTLELDREVEAEVAEDRRRAIARAHTATHLLHHALREVLGSHVAQAGSLVEPDRLRFDFSHFAAVTDEQLAEVSALVTRRILENAAVGTRVTTVDEAKQAGAIALFGEKYGAEVRMVQIGEFSRELCGGTHVDQVAAAGLVLITRESSVGAGLRRIEAVTGLQAAALAVDDLNALTSAAQLLRAPKDALLDRVGELLREVHTLKRDLASARQRRASTSLDDFLGQAVTVNDMRVIAARAPELDADGLRTLADSLLDRLGSGVVVLGSVAGEKVLLVSKVSKDLVPRGAHAGNLVREVAKATGGNGGGRPDFAQAGGRDPEKLDDALALVPTLLAGS